MILTGWLLHSIRLVAALGTALLLMQAPAVTREYQAALLQLVRSSDQEPMDFRQGRAFGAQLQRQKAAFSPAPRTRLRT